MNKTIGDRVKELRNYLNLNQTEFGNKINKKQTTIAGYENNSKNVLDRTIKDICRVYNVSYAWLVNGDGDMFSNSDAILKDKVDQIMEGSSDLHKKILKSVLELDDEDLIYFEKWLSNFIDK